MLSEPRMKSVTNIDMREILVAVAHVRLNTYIHIKLLYTDCATPSILCNETSVVQFEILI